MPSVDVLFEPFDSPNLKLKNRIVMAPMTRGHAPGGIPGDKQVAYYSKRAKGGTGLILTEGTPPDHPPSYAGPELPVFYGQEALKGWKRVADAVHAEGGKIIPQLWHIGGVSYDTTPKDIPRTTPSGISPEGKLVGEPLTEEQLADLQAAYVRSSVAAKENGFDGVELHACHGYLLDLFFWDRTNQRTDQWGGDMVRRVNFPAETAKAVRKAVGPDFPLLMRLSQWKSQDFTAKIYKTPKEMEEFLQPIVESGVDILDCSTRRFWEPEFEGSALNLAGWAKKLTGLPSISVGSVGLSSDVMTMGVNAEMTPIDALIDKMEREEFDLIAVGRMLIADPEWANKVREGRMHELRPFSREVFADLI